MRIFSLFLLSRAILFSMLKFSKQSNHFEAIFVARMVFGIDSVVTELGERVWEVAGQREAIGVCRCC